MSVTNKSLGREFSKDKMYESTSLAILKTPGCFSSNVKNPSLLNCSKLSPYYLDLRLIPSYPEYMNVVVEDMIDLIDRSMEIPGNIDKLITTESAGIPICSMVSRELEIGMGWDKKESKGHGKKKDIEGYFKSGEHVVGVDDLATEAKAAVKAVKDVRKIGGIINHYCVEHDRNQGAQKVLEDLNVKLHYLSQTNSRFMKLAYEEGVITGNDYEILGKYAKDTDRWSRDFVANNPDFIKKELASVVENGIIKKWEPLNVLTKGHPELLEEFKPMVLDWLKELNVREEVPEFGYKPLKNL